MLNGTGGRTSNLLLKSSRVFCRKYAQSCWRRSTFWRGGECRWYWHCLCHFNLLFKQKHQIQLPCRRKQQWMLSFLKSSASQEKDGRKSTTTSVLRNIKSLQIFWAHCMDVCCIVTKIVIPSTLRSQVLDLLHEGHFGIQRMQQLARTVFYWPNIDNGQRWSRGHKARGQRH